MQGFSRCGEQAGGEGNSSIQKPCKAEPPKPFVAAAAAAAAVASHGWTQLAGSGSCVRLTNHCLHCRQRKGSVRQPASLPAPQ
jgi:hypothetical protein